SPANHSTLTCGRATSSRARPVRTSKIRPMSALAIRFGQQLEGIRMAHDHDHTHGDGHHHHEPEPYAALRTRALESLLIEKGVLSSDAVDAIVDLYGQDIGPLRGARVVARAWLDADFKRRLLADANATIAELGWAGAPT